jgi:ATP-dependent Clp protease ATP-binding subunit ClpA
MECLNDKLGSALVGRFNAIVEYLELTRDEAIEIIKLNLVKSLEKKIKNVASSTRTNISVEYSPSIDEFAERLLEDNNEQFKQNGARVLIEQVESIWDLVIPELALVYVGGIKEYEKSKVVLTYDSKGVDVVCKKTEHGPLSYTNVKR